MGYIGVKAVVWNPAEPSRRGEVEMLVGTGAVYTLLPRSLLESLGIRPLGRSKFRLADGRVMEREVGVIGIEVMGERAYTTVIFGEEGIYLLGVVALKELGLEVDPVRGQLRPLELLLM